MSRLSFKTIWMPVFLIAVTSGVAACESVETKAEYPTRRRAGMQEADYNNKRQTIFGEGGLNLFGGKDKDTASGGSGVSGITVNAYLWRASLDTINFMPIANADPFGGTILTDWYEAPEAKGERVKANIFVMGRTLRTDALKVTLFRQVKTSSGQWQDATVAPQTVTDLENAILSRARQLRVAENGE